MAKFGGFAATFTLEYPKIKRGGGTTNFYSISQRALETYRHYDEATIVLSLLSKGVSGKDATDIAVWLNSFFK